METFKVVCEESLNTMVKMKKGPGRPKKSEAIIKDVKRRTKRPVYRNSLFKDFLSNFIPAKPIWVSFG